LKGDIFLAADLWRDKNNQTKKKVVNTVRQKERKAVTEEQDALPVDKEILDSGLVEPFSSEFRRLLQHFEKHLTIWRKLQNKFQGALLLVMRQE